MKKSPAEPRYQTLVVAAGRALCKAAKTARKTARNYGTPGYILKDGKIVAEKPYGFRWPRPRPTHGLHANLVDLRERRGRFTGTLVRE